MRAVWPEDGLKVAAKNERVAAKNKRSYREPPEDALLLARAFDSGGKGMAPPVFIDEPHVEPPQLEMLMQSSGAAAPIIRRAGNTTEAEEEEQPPEITPLGELLGVIPPP